jgi:polysaccharide deacetylase 2 family uncharacterized protein YibQ
LDSLVSSNSVCIQVATEKQVPFAERDIFLDNKLDTSYIRGQLVKLKNKAAARGKAIGIGHDRRATLEVLKEEIPNLEKEGYKFVFISDLVK